GRASRLHARRISEFARVGTKPQSVTIPELAATWNSHETRRPPVARASCRRMRSRSAGAGPARERSRRAEPSSGRGARASALARRCPDPRPLREHGLADGHLGRRGAPRARRSGPRHARAPRPRRARTLEDTADLIYPGAKQFYGHGVVVPYDL